MKTPSNMDKGKKRDPGPEVSAEVKKARTFSKDTAQLQHFWDSLYRDTYHEVLESRDETGRHGIIMEYITRTMTRGDILDIGCGTGILAELLDAEKFRYTGIDLSPEAIERAKRKMPGSRHTFILGRFEDFAPQKKFEVIVCNEVAYYVDAEILLEKCSQLLTQEGHIIFSLFDFPEGRQLLPEIRKQIINPFTVTLTNDNTQITWHLLAGKLKKTS